jgi:hypothetical protein
MLGGGGATGVAGGDGDVVGMGQPNKGKNPWAAACVEKARASDARNKITKRCLPLIGPSRCFCQLLKYMHGFP